MTRELLDSSKFSKIRQYHSMTFFSKKMIFIEIWYEIYNLELLAIIDTFKILHHYLEGYKYKVFIFTNYNNLQKFIDNKSLGTK